MAPWNRGGSLCNVRLIGLLIVTLLAPSCGPTPATIPRPEPTVSPLTSTLQVAARPTGTSLQTPLVILPATTHPFTATPSSGYPLPSQLALPVGTSTPAPPLRVTELRLHAQPSGAEDLGVSDSDRLHAMNILVDRNTYQIMIRIRLSRSAGVRIPIRLYSYNGGAPTQRAPVIDTIAVPAHGVYWSEISDNGNTEIIGAHGTSVWYLEVADPDLQSAIWGSYIRIIKPQDG